MKLKQTEQQQSNNKRKTQNAQTHNQHINNPTANKTTHHTIKKTITNKNKIKNIHLKRTTTCTRHST